MEQTYLTTDELSAKIKYDVRTIRAVEGQYLSLIHI